MKRARIATSTPATAMTVVTVLKTEEKMAEDTQRILAGEQPEGCKVAVVFFPNEHKVDMSLIRVGLKNISG